MIGCLALSLGLASWLSGSALRGQEPNAFRLPAAPAEAAQDDATGRALVQRGTVTFRETPLAEVLLILSEQWNVNIIAGADIQGQVNGTFKQETLKAILDSILISNGLKYQKIGNSLVVLTNNETGSSRSDYTVEVLDAQVSTSEELEQLITALKLQMSPDGQLVPLSATGKLTILDTPERIAAVKALLAQLVPAAAAPPTYVSQTGEPNSSQVTDQSGSTQGNSLFSLGSSSSELTAIELRPQYTLASDLQATLAALVGETNVSVIAAENSIVIFGDPSIHRRATLLMHQLDKPRPQVRITGYIYDVDVNELEKLGVDWSQKNMSTGLDANGVPNNMTFGGTGLLTPSAITNSANSLSGVVLDTAGTAGAAAGGAAGGAAGATAAAAGPVGGQFLVRTLSSSMELQMLVQALEQTKGSRLLADPHITVVDRHLASFEAKTRIPIQQLTQTQQGGSIGSTSFVDAGITLSVTPRIANDGTIEMELTPVFSTLVGFDREGRPIIDERSASTVIRVNNAQALAIGGLRRKNTVETVKGIPGLMNIKYLGALFRTHDTDVRESELLVFIMPEIVTYCGGSLPREMAALEVAQQQLSRISTAVDGPFTPDCKDKHCPNHNERPRIHNGLQDNGLIGTYDMVFIDPQATMVSPQPTQFAPSAVHSGEVPQIAPQIQLNDRAPPRVTPAPVSQQPVQELPIQELPVQGAPVQQAAVQRLPVSQTVGQQTAGQPTTSAAMDPATGLRAEASSRRVSARPATFRRP